MNNNNTEHSHANISPLRRVSGLWLIPIVTVITGLWLIYENWSSQGPLITISFESAEGLQEGKTKIKRRNIEVGQVTSITLNKNLDSVMVTARMHYEIRNHLAEDSRFWVVQPSIGLSGVSGLDTIVSGQYIEFSPGQSKKHSKKFGALDGAPLTPPGTPGLHVTLNSLDNFSYNKGDAILYNGFKVGKVEDVYFNSNERMMYYNTFVEAPYHELLTTNTRFWDTSGIRMEVTSNGFAIQTAGLQSILTGGISFGLPEGEPQGEQVTERAYYLIYPDQQASQEKHYEQSIHYILLVDDSVSGLHVGAPVIMRGLRVGSVVRAGYIPENGNLLDKDMQIPIQIEINPARLGLTDNPQGQQAAQEALDQWLGQGMYATIKVQNLLLGQQSIELNYPDEIITAQVSTFQDLIVIPVNQTSISQIAEKVSELVNNMNEINFSGISKNLEVLLAETTTTMQKVSALAGSGEAVFSDANQQSLINTLNNTINDVGDLTKSYATDSPANKDLRKMLKDMSEALSDLKPLLAELKNKPNGLIFSGRRQIEPEPRGQ